MTASSRPGLLLVAASGLAREALVVVRAQGSHAIVGFLDDAETLSGTTIEGVPVLGPIADVSRYPDAELIVCAGRGSSREAIVARLTSHGVPTSRFASVVHHSVLVPEGCRVGPGAIILGGVVMTASVSIGAHVVVMPNATLTHDCELQDFTTVCAGVALGGHVTLQRGAYIGMNASVREHVKVGVRSVLGMGSVLLRDLPAGETWAGVPARTLTSGAS